jgi:hypothetical protein
VVTKRALLSWWRKIRNHSNTIDQNLAAEPLIEEKFGLIPAERSGIREGNNKRGLGLRIFSEIFTTPNPSD